jgi:hypothetical protein
MIDTIRSRLRTGDHELAVRLAARSETVMWGALLSQHFSRTIGSLMSSWRAFENEVTMDRLIGLLHHLSARELEPEQRQRLVS